MFYYVTIKDKLKGVILALLLLGRTNIGIELNKLF
jgi:hypothetical protein